MLETGTEMSCLRLAPWWRCASGTDSRSFHIACDCASEVAIEASLRRSARPLPASCSVKYAGQALAGIGRAQLDEHIPGGAEVQRIGDARDVLHRELDARSAASARMS